MSENPAPLVWKFPLGLDQRAREYALAEGSAQVLTNVDVTRDGGLRCRMGLRAVLGGDCHSLFVPPHHRFALLVRNGALCRIDRIDAALDVTPLSAAVGPVAYAPLHEDVYWTDGAQVGRVDENGNLAPWGLAVPPAPRAVAVGSGGLFAGVYQVALTALHPSGLESGAAEPVTVEVPEGGGIQVTVPSATGVRFAVYRTPAQGGSDELRQAWVAAPEATGVLGVQTLGRRLESLAAVRPVPGHALLAWRGRLWIAAGSVVWVTSERSPHWLFPDQGYFAFESPVTLLGAADDGVYIGLTDRLYFLQGADLDSLTQRPVADCGAASGGGAAAPLDLFSAEGALPGRQCLFFDRDGFLCIGKPGGMILRPTQPRWSAGALAHGVLTYRAQEGLRQVVALLTHAEAQGIETAQASSTPIQERFSHD